MTLWLEIEQPQTCIIRLFLGMFDLKKCTVCFYSFIIFNNNKKLNDILFYTT